MRRGAAALLTVVLAIGAMPLASAEVYSNGPAHYHFTPPMLWIAQSLSGVDVVYTEGSIGGAFTPNLNALHAADRTAKNDSAYLQRTAAESLAELKTQMNGTVVQPSRVFTAGSGRLAADYIMDYDHNRTTLRVRQVLFASDILDMGWVLTFTAAQADFDSRTPYWDAVTASFGVDSEVAPGPALPYLVLLFGIVGAAAGGGIFLLARQRRARYLAEKPAVAGGYLGVPSKLAPPQPPQAAPPGPQPPLGPRP